MVKTENNLIKAWQVGACLIILHTVGENQTEQIQELAREQLQLLNETRLNKEKALKDQLNNEQKELVTYLENVIETGEF